MRSTALPDQQALDARARIATLEAALARIDAIASSCHSDMQGRLADETHRRAHDVLANIARTASSALT